MGACYKDSIQEQEAAAIKKRLPATEAALNLFITAHLQTTSQTPGQGNPCILVLSVPALNKLIPQALSDGMRGTLEIQTVPTLLMGQVKQWLAMAAFLASMGHSASLQQQRGSSCSLLELQC